MNLYGTSHEGGTASIGTFFSVSPSGTETTLYSFDGTKGSYPDHGLILASDGNFYATTPIGGTSNLGTLYKMTSAGAITVLYNFNNANGSSNGAPPVQGTDGNFYGVTGCPIGSLTCHVYKMTPAGVVQLLACSPVEDCSDRPKFFTAPLHYRDLSKASQRHCEVMLVDEDC